MPDGTRPPSDRLDLCAKTMKRITREWATLEASGPRAGPVREAITRLEPVFHAQMVLALQQWVEGPGVRSGPSTERLRALADQITAPDAAEGPDALPQLTAIDFVQLWPAVLKEQRED